MFRPVLRTALRTAPPRAALRPAAPLLTRPLSTPSAPTTTTSTSTRPPPPPSTPLSGYVETVEINTAPTISLPARTKNLISSLLDLFAGHPSLPLLSCWAPDCTLTTPLHTATGRAQVAAQWWGYKKIMSDIKVVDHEVRSVSADGRELELWVCVRYEVPVVGRIEVPRSVEVRVNEAGEIQGVWDRWEGGWRKVRFGEVVRRGVVLALERAVEVPGGGKRA